MKIKYSDIIKNQPTINVGTIGHVASGKSTLVFQITGTKTQKFSNEQDRNITITVGYANAKIFIDSEGNLHTAKSDCENLTDGKNNEMKLIGHISFVDCPGHEDYMSNMVNGSAVMDMSILVVASNENIPQPQTKEHLEAVECIGLNKYIILQNKMDLIDEEDNDDVLEKINNFISNSRAEKSKIIPSSIQSGVNTNAVLKSIVNLSSGNFEEKINKPARLTIIRSFDINKPNIYYKELKGGVVGGSLMSGYLKVGDVVEIRPGRRVKQANGSFRYAPFISKVTSLKSDNNNMDIAFAGGLIGVGLDLDPIFTGQNKMVGQVLGLIGTLPDVYSKLTIVYELMGDNFDLKFKVNEKIAISGNATRAEGVIKSYKAKKNLLEIDLDRPICLALDQKITIHKNISSKWRLVGNASLKSGVKCERVIVEQDLYDKLLSNTDKNSVEIEYDVNLTDYQDSLEEENYNELLKNVRFNREDDKFKNINIPPVSSTYKHPKTIIFNYPDLCRSVNLAHLIVDKSEIKDKYEKIFKINIVDDVNFATLIQRHMEKELTCTSTINGENQLCLRNKLLPKRIEDLMRTFVNSYLKCLSCKSPLSFIQKKDRKLRRYCLRCKSITTIVSK